MKPRRTKSLTRTGDLSAVKTGASRAIAQKNQQVAQQLGWQNRLDNAEKQFREISTNNRDITAFQLEPTESLFARDTTQTKEKLDLFLDEALTTADNITDGKEYQENIQTLTNQDTYGTYAKPGLQFLNFLIRPTTNTTTIPHRNLYEELPQYEYTLWKFFEHLMNNDRQDKAFELYKHFAPTIIKHKIISNDTSWDKTIPTTKPFNIEKDKEAVIKTFNTDATRGLTSVVKFINDPNNDLSEEEQLTLKALTAQTDFSVTTEFSGILMRAYPEINFSQKPIDRQLHISKTENKIVITISQDIFSFHDENEYGEVCVQKTELPMLHAFAQYEATITPTTSTVTPRRIKFGLVPHHPLFVSKLNQEFKKSLSTYTSDYSPVIDTNSISYFKLGDFVGITGIDTETGKKVTDWLDQLTIQGADAEYGLSEIPQHACLPEKKIMLWRKGPAHLEMVEYLKIPKKTIAPENLRTFHDHVNLQNITKPLHLQLALDTIATFADKKQRVNIVLDPNINHDAITSNAISNFLKNNPQAILSCKSGVHTELIINNIVEIIAANNNEKKISNFTNELQLLTRLNLNLEELQLKLTLITEIIRIAQPLERTAKRSYHQIIGKLNVDTEIPLNRNILQLYEELDRAHELLSPSKAQTTTINSITKSDLDNTTEQIAHQADKLKLTTTLEQQITQLHTNNSEFFKSLSAKINTEYQPLVMSCS
ncbi:MAG: hypothetical protein KAS93_00575 [Gammaproteobacteria bacterium]|nr:hypothetical protein [Gammaproteobacteria bacterium]